MKEKKEKKMVVAKAGALLVHEGFQHHLQERTSDLYVLRSIAVPPRSQADTWSGQSLRRHAAMGARGMNECQGTPWNEEFDGNELHGAAGGDLEPRGSAVSCTSSTRSQPALYHLQVWCYYGFKGVVLFIDRLYFCTIPDCIFPRGLCFCTYRFDFRLLTRA